MLYISQFPTPVLSGEFFHSVEKIRNVVHVAKRQILIKKKFPFI